jgi:predicted MFS family arabinose efflux permease
MNAIRTWLAKVPGDPPERRLLAASFADALGTGLFLPLSVIYLTRIVGLSPARVGLGLTIAGILAIAAPPLSGALLGRIDARKVVLGCFAASAFGFLAYIAVGSFFSFLGVAIVVQFAGRMERPASALLALGVTPRARQVKTLALQYSLRNLGYGAGGLLAAVALASGRLGARELGRRSAPVSHPGPTMHVTGLRAEMNQVASNSQDRS